MATSRPFVAVLVATLGVAPASADSIFFSNLGPGDSYNEAVATFFGFDTGEEGDPDFRFARAMPFVSGRTGTLGALELPILFPFSFSNGSLVINLFEASNGLPDGLLETFTRTQAYSDRRPLAFRSEVKPRLQSGTTYFIEATTRGKADGIWYLSLLDQKLQPDVLRFNDGPWQARGVRDFTAAFRVSGDAASAVPEPASMVLVAAALAAAGARRRRRPGNRRQSSQTTEGRRDGREPKTEPAIRLC